MVLSAEWLQTASTVLPMLLVAYWMMWTLGWLWRRSIWERVGFEATQLNGQIRPTWTGWCVDAGELRVQWTGGILGLRTQVSQGDHTWTVPGLVSVDQAKAS